ncbi:MAG: ribbon-helix-helix protein, CopG family [Deltaproteobacteria bacterium]|nr:MAG: ribbon-helix-helix protein, CopG family [Deltaproteobacteria bacterium]
MHRTQIYMDESVIERLSQISRQKKTSISNLIRQAVEKAYGKKISKEERWKKLSAACGIWKDRDDLPPTDEYVRSLRKNTRMKRFGLE